MTDLEILECCQSVLDFLEEDPSEEEFEQHGFNTPMNSKMDKVLRDHGYTQPGLMHTMPMVAFCMELNQEYKIHDRLWDKEPREFFSTIKSRNFLKQIMRELKLNILYHEQ